ncbi:MAG TPA: outer membrane beta-barrel protein [Polyangiaceae bacterium]|jgi:hypothetical protein
MPRWLKSCLPVVLGALFAPSTAHAFERQWHVGGGVGLTSYLHDYQLGPSLGLNAAYGISDMFDVRVELLGSTHLLSSEATTRVAYLAHTRAEQLSAAAGLTYKLDVLQWIPYGGVLLGYRHVRGALPPLSDYGRDDAMAALLVGLDYAASRSFGLGLSWRGDSALSSFANTESMTVMLRAEYHWGF